MQQNLRGLPRTGTEFESTVRINFEKIQIDTPSEKDGSMPICGGQRVLKENIMGATTGRNKSVELIGLVTVSRRNLNVYGI